MIESKGSAGTDVSRLFVVNLYSDNDERYTEQIKLANMATIVSCAEYAVIDHRNNSDRARIQTVSLLNKVVHESKEKMMKMLEDNKTNKEYLEGMIDFLVPGPLLERAEQLLDELNGNNNRVEQNARKYKPIEI